MDTCCSRGMRTRGAVCREGEGRQEEAQGQVRRPRCAAPKEMACIGGLDRVASSLWFGVVQAAKGTVLEQESPPFPPVLRADGTKERTCQAVQTGSHRLCGAAGALHSPCSSCRLPSMATAPTISGCIMSVGAGGGGAGASMGAVEQKKIKHAQVRHLMIRAIATAGSLQLPHRLWR